MTAPLAAAPLFETRKLRRIFPDGTEAIGELSLAIGTGSFVTLVGPSGCGKSTFLRIVAGLDSASAGTLAWSDGPPGRGDIGFVFQEPTLLPWASLRENVYLPLRLAGRSRAAAAADIEATIRLVGLEDFAHVRPRRLSGGMKMRASVARALVTRPRLLLMDEPFAALDEITRFRLNDDLLRIWAAQRCTVVFVTHSIFEAAYLAQRIVVMSPRPGRVVADIAVDLPYPRRPAMRTESGYAAVCRRVSDSLAEAAA